MSLGMSRDHRVSEEKRDLAKRLRREATPSEAALWEALRGRRLGGFKFRRQQPLNGYIVDFYCEVKDLAVEVDGSIHDDAAARDRDALRESHINAVGVKVIRFSDIEVLHELPKVLTKLLEALQHP